MQKFYKPVIGGFLSLAILGLGFVLGSQVGASAIPEPGSADDPLVTKSYVDQKMAEKIAQLESKVAQLQQKADALQKAAGGKVEAVGTQPVSGTTTVVDTSRGGSGAAALGTGTVDGALVRLRSGPGTNYKVLQEVPGGTRVTLLESQNGWYKLRLADGKEGWMLGEYIK